SGSDSLEPRFQPVVDRVAEAMNDEPGTIIVQGHSDNVPIRTARFPSNLHLSLARAKAVMERIADKLEDRDRVSAEGRAEKEPIAPNDTAEGRAKNRRIEVLLVKAG
ncbi:MAG: OmpA family protein, partial [Pseudomonadota bacterium]